MGKNVYKGVAQKNCARLKKTGLFIINLAVNVNNSLNRSDPPLHAGSFCSESPSNMKYMVNYITLYHSFQLSLMVASATESNKKNNLYLSNLKLKTYLNQGLYCTFILYIPSVQEVVAHLYSKLLYKRAITTSWTYNMHFMRKPLSSWQLFRRNCSRWIRGMSNRSLNHFCI